MLDPESSDITADELLAQLPTSEPDPERVTIADVKSDDLLKEPEVEDTSEDVSPEAPEEEATETPESEEPIAETEEEPEEEGLSPADAELLADFKQRGLGEYKTVAAALDGFKAGKNALSRRDEDAAFGRSVKERGVTPDQLEALVSNKDTPEKKAKSDNGIFQPPHEFNPAWATMIRETKDDDGNVTGHTGPPAEVQKYLEYTAFEQSFWDRVRRDPSALVSPDVIKQLVEEKLNETRAAQKEEDVKSRAAEATEKFLDDHGEFVSAHEGDFFGLVNSGVDPEVAIEHLKMKERLEALEKESSTGPAAIQKDIGKKVARTTRRAGVKKTPIREEKFDPSKASSDDLLNRAVEKMLDDDHEVPTELAL